jgi:hypothetical protein
MERFLCFSEMVESGKELHEARPGIPILRALLRGLLDYRHSLTASPVVGR